MNHIEQLQARVAQAAQEAALLEAQARAVNELAAEARARLVCLRSDLAAALREQGRADSRKTVLEDGRGRVISGDVAQ